MTTVGGTNSVTNTPSVYSGTTGSATAGKNELGKDAFLSLLVAQLKYQDPSSPTDSSQFMAQTAQFTLVEKMEELAASQSAMLASSQLSSATALVGRSISWTESTTTQTESGPQTNTVTKTGRVTGLSMTNGTPTLLVGDTEVALGAVTKVDSA
jgi:flagellar basal-body rod modification protein FlgD